MTSALPMLQPDEYKSLNTTADDTALELVNLRLHVDDLSAIIANQEQRIDQLIAEKATVYEQARRDADARLELATHITAELWRRGDEIDTQTKSGIDATLDSLFDVDVPEWLEQMMWATTQVLKSPECLTVKWLQSISWCLVCARNGHKCNVAPCGLHHDPHACKECAAIVAADRSRDEERAR